MSVNTHHTNNFSRSCAGERNSRLTPTPPPLFHISKRGTFCKARVDITRVSGLGSHPRVSFVNRPPQGVIVSSCKVSKRGTFLTQRKSSQLKPTNQMTDQPKFHDMTQPALFKPSIHTVLTRGLNAMTKACEAQELLISVMKADLAASELRCEELIARNAQLEERHNLNKGEVE